MAVGDWFQLTSSNLSAVNPATNPGGSFEGKVTAWTSFAIDSRNSKVYQVAQGGHADYAGNEADMLDLETATPAWVARRAPTATVSNANYYADGRPTSRHGYYGATINETDNQVMLIGGARWSDGGHLSHLDSYSITSNDYAASGTHPDFPTGSTGTNFQTVRSVARNPATDDIWMFANYNVQKWTRSTNTWSTPVSNQMGQFFENAGAAYDTSRNRIYLSGDSKSYTYDLSSTFTLATQTGTDITATGAIGIEYVPTLDAFLARTLSSGGTVYSINASTFAVTSMTTSGGGSVPVTSNGPFRKWLYAPRLKGFFYCPVHTAGCWFFKAHA